MQVTIHCSIPKVEDLDAVLNKVEDIVEAHYLDDCALQIEVYDPDKYGMRMATDDETLQDRIERYLEEKARQEGQGR